SAASAASAAAGAGAAGVVVGVEVAGGGAEGIESAKGRSPPFRGTTLRRGRSRHRRRRPLRPVPRLPPSPRRTASRSGPRCRRRGVPDRQLCAGPARLCEALGVTGALNGASLQRGSLRILRAGRPAGTVAVGPRVGITRAADWPLRFYFKDSPWVSAAR